MSNRNHSHTLHYCLVVLPLIILILLAAASLAYLVFIQIQRLHMDWEIEQIVPEELKPLAAHMVVGFNNDAELDLWVKRRYVGGIYLTERNLRGKSFGQVRAQLANLQQWRRSQGLPPLWIMADQEGGTVSRLSPLLTSLPPLSSLVEKQPDTGEGRGTPTALDVEDYAQVHARELSRLGVNVNLAPVVDLKPKWKPSMLDLHTRLVDRAIDGDPQTVTFVAQHYCASLLDQGVIPVLKHFPGLGRVRADTHDYCATLTARPSLLEYKDWIPFRSLSGEKPVWMMLSHVVMTAVDPDYPVSQSQKVVGKILRRDWHCGNILITDDMCMKPYRDGPGGIGQGAVRSLNAGVDLLLISHLPEMATPVLLELVKARRSGDLRERKLLLSRDRLHRASTLLENPAPDSLLAAPKEALFHSAFAANSR